jgi:hypothetical protein
MAEQAFSSYSDPPLRLRYERLLSTLQSEPDFQTGILQAQTTTIGQALDKLLTD